MSYPDHRIRPLVAAFASLWLWSAPASAAQTLTLNSGWNLIALHSEPAVATTTVAELFNQEGVEAVFSYHYSGWLSYQPQTQSGTLGTLPIANLLNRGLWVKVAPNRSPTLELTGAEHPFDPAELKQGWNLVGLGSTLTTTAQLEALLQPQITKPLRLFAFRDYGWQIRDFEHQRGSLNTLNPNEGLWIYTLQPLPIGESSSQQRVSVGSNLSAQIYSRESYDVNRLRSLTLTLNGQMTTLTVPAVSRYQLEVVDAPQGNIVTTATVENRTESCDSPLSGSAVTGTLTGGCSAVRQLPTAEPFYLQIHTPVTGEVTHLTPLYLHAGPAAPPRPVLSQTIDLNGVQNLASITAYNGQTIRLEALGAATSYRWEYGAAAPATGSYLSLRYLATGRQIVTLTVGFSNGSSATYTLPIEVIADGQTQFSTMPPETIPLYLFTPVTPTITSDEVQLQTPSPSSN